jgi:hypothetical protein
VLGRWAFGWVPLIAQPLNLWHDSQQVRNSQYRMAARQEGFTGHSIRCQSVYLALVLTCVKGVLPSDLLRDWCYILLML